MYTDQLLFCALIKHHNQGHLEKEEFTWLKVWLCTLKAHPQRCASFSMAMPPKVSMTFPKSAQTRDQISKYLEPTGDRLTQTPTNICRERESNIKPSTKCSINPRNPTLY